MFGSITSTFLVLAVVVSLPVMRKLQLQWRWAFCIALAYLLNFQWRDLSVTGYITGIVGELSLTTTTILLLLIVSRLTSNQPDTNTGNQLIEKNCVVHLAASLGIIALFLYPMALGATAFDPYELGFQPQFLILATLAYSISVIILGYFPIALILSAVLVGYSFNIMESNNYWDYLMDPFIAIYGVGCFLLQLNYALRWLFSADAKRRISQSEPLIWRPQSNNAIPQNVETSAGINSANKQIVNSEKV